MRVSSILSFVIFCVINTVKGIEFGKDAFEMGAVAIARAFVSLVTRKSRV